MDSREPTPTGSPRFRALLRRWTGWSNTGQAWGDRLVLLSLLGAVCLLAWVSSSWSFWPWVGSWVGFVLLLVGLERLGFVQLAGPVLRSDLVRSARRTRFYFIRVGYLVVLLTILCMMYTSAFPEVPWYRPLRISSAARFATRFFQTFLFVQFAAAVLLTPAYTAGTIAEEKERRTLEFILASALHDREIILGKLLSRLGHLLMLLLGGLPVLCLVQFLGGIDPNLVLASFTMTGLTLASTAAVSILASVLARRARDAILLAYLFVALFFGLPFLLRPMVAWLGLGSFPSTDTWTSPVTLDTLVDFATAGHPYYAFQRLAYSISLRSTLPTVVRDFAIFHGVLFAGALLAATLLVRRRGLAERTQPKQAKQARKLERVGLWPMVWKEVTATHGWGQSARLMLFFLAVLGFTLWFFVETSGPLSRLSYAVNLWVRVMGTFLSALMVLMVSIRAAGSIRGDYENHTMDSILTTPLTATEILFGKWLGAMASVRALAVCLAAMYAVGFFTLGLSIFAILLLAFAICCYAGCAASLGLWYSLACRTSLRASVSTLFSLIGLACGHWVIWFCLGPMLLGSSGVGFDLFEGLLKFQAGFTPPVAVGWFLAFPQESPDYMYDFFSLEMVVFSVLGALVWVLIAWIIWQKTLTTFAKQTARHLSLDDPDDPEEDDDEAEEADENEDEDESD